MTAVNTLSNPGSSNASAENAGIMAWSEFAQMYPFYVALARQCGFTPPPHDHGAVPIHWPDRKAMERDLAWLQKVDAESQAVHLRQFLATPSATKEEALRAYVRRQLAKPEKNDADRDKIDLLVVQYFALCATPEMIAAGLDINSVAKVLQPILGDFKPGPVACCQPLDQILADAEKCGSLRELFEGGLMERARIVKESAGSLFYESAALTAICRFNFLLRRIFIQLLHCELRAVGEALIELERRGTTTVDCRRAGFSSEESIAGLREFRQQWRAPFQTNYTQPGAFRSFERLLTLRSDLEDALSNGAAAAGGLGEKATPVAPPVSVRDQASAGKSFALKPAGIEPAQSAQGERPPTDKSSAAGISLALPTPAQAPGPALSPDACEEIIWEQLIATPPVRGRSMTTVNLEDNTRALLSAWEVAAFVTESGPESEEIRKAIVARAMLAMAVDRRKRFLDLRSLHDAMAHAKKDIPRFQEHIEQLKRAKKVENAVNLGITVKRLLSVLEEAEELVRGGASEEKR
jgi:hypothetical protein